MPDLPTAPPPSPSEITPPEVWQRRRQLLLGGAASLLASTASHGEAHPAARPLTASLPNSLPGSQTDEKPTAAQHVRNHGNFYEFGPDKDSPARNAHRLRTQPWTLSIEGEVARPRLLDVDTLLKEGLEERIYRLRCVEGWSAVIPWLGIPLARLLKAAEPTSNARFVEFWSLADPEQMPYVRLPLLDWPYQEALRLDEALHPLTLLAVGMYGETLLPQNGAPIRLVVPWKYGFKSAKSLVRIRVVSKPPTTSWMKAAPEEYGFYANVMPDVPHKRWSQARERRLGEWLRRPTLPFNGYAEHVASLYSGLDLTRNF